MSLTLSFPDNDPGLLQWSLNFLTLITATPTAYNLVAGDATSYQVVHEAYADALLACDPAVRNKTSVVAKNQARANLKKAALLLANKVYAGANVTNAQKTQLGIPPRATPQSSGVPASAPVVEVIDCNAWMVQIRLRAATGAHRGKLPGTAGASVFSYVGAQAPADMGAWKFEGSCGRVEKINLSFPTDLPAGTKVWITAFWFNNKKQSGPAASPVSANLLGGSVQMAE